MTKAMRRVIATVALLSILATILASPIALAYLYRAPVTVTENASTAYTMLPVLWDQNNTWLAANGFMSSTANDTRVQTLGGSNKPWMVADNKTLTAIPVPADSQTNLYFTTGESEVSAMDIILGYNGYVTIADAAALEPAADFEFEHDAYVDTTYAVPDFPTVEAVGGGNDVVNATDHTVNLPTGVASGDLLIVLFVTDEVPAITFPAGWTELFEDVGAGNVNFEASYRIADGTEGATITVTTANAQMTAHTSYRISGYSGVPEVGVSVTANNANPDPPNLTPSWGAENTLWLAVSGYNVGTVTVNAYPANYTDGINDRSNHAEGAGVGSARREINAVSENPGTFTLSAGQDWVANTIAIQPLKKNLLSKAAAFETYISAATDITSTILPAVASVTASGVATGEHTVKTIQASALLFDGANDNVDVGDHAIHALSGVDLTLEAWVNPTSMATGFIMQKNIDANNSYLFEIDPNGLGRWVFQVKDGGNSYAVLYTSGDVSGNWIHVIGTYRASDQDRHMYYNGVEQGATAGITTSANNVNLVFGDRALAPAFPLDGKLYGVRIYSRVISPTEALEHYQGVYTDETGLVGHWEMDDVAGAVVADTSGYGFDGTINGATWSYGSLRIVVDGVQEDVATGGAVPGNANDWVLAQDNVMPYMDYYSHTVSGVEVVRYEPTSIILGTTLPNELNPGTNDAVITWGANPASVGATLGSMSSSGQPSVGSATDTSTSDLLPVVGGTDWNQDPSITGSLLTNPFRPIVTVVSDNTTLTERQVWVWYGIIFVVFVTVLVGSKVRGHHLITGIAVSVAIILLVVWTVFPWFALIVVVLAVFFGLVSERAHSL